MNESLKISQSGNADAITIKLVGQIDEDADYSGANFAKVTQVTFDFEKVTLVNSTGLQKWISFLKTIPERVKICFEKCPPRIVKQIDIFPAFLANRQVNIVSFYAPYFCEACNKPMDVLLQKIMLKTLSEAPEAKCPKCAKNMEFDAVEKKYFLFLNNVKAA